MACAFHAFTFPRWLSYTTTPAALGISANGPVTIVGWANYFDPGADTIMALVADDGAEDSFIARKQMDDRFTSEMIVDSAFSDAFVSGVSIDTWYFVEWFLSSDERSVRLNNGSPDVDSTPLGTIAPFTALTISVGNSTGGGPGMFEGCLAELAVLNRALTTEERASLASGLRPPDVFGLDNIAFYVPLADYATSDQAYLYGVSVTMDIPQLEPAACADGPSLTEPDGEGEIATTTARSDVNIEGL